MATIRTRESERRLVVRGDAGKVLLHDGAAGGAAVAEGLLGLCDGGLGDLEGLGTGWWLRVCGGGGEGEQKSEERTSHALSIFVRPCLNSATLAPRKINRTGDILGFAQAHEFMKQLKKEVAQRVKLENEFQRKALPVVWCLFHLVRSYPGKERMEGPFENFSALGHAYIQRTEPDQHNKRAPVISLP